MFERLDKEYDGDAMQTPKYIINWLNDRYHFDIDLAASDEHHLFDQYLTKDNDATKKNWRPYGTSGFCNPPYSRGNIEKFITKAIQQSKIGFVTAMLIPELNGEARTRDIMTYPRKIYHFDKRINFIHPVTGKEVKGNSRGSIVVEFGYNTLNIAPVHILINLDDIKSQYA